MITVKKIQTLKPRVQLRKIGDIFHQAASKKEDRSYLDSVLSYLLSTDLVEEGDKRKIRDFYSRCDSSSYLDIYYYILNILGESPADWDIVDGDGIVDWSKRKFANHFLYLDHLRSPYNVGSIFRSAESFAVKEIFLSDGCASPSHVRARRTSRDTVDAIPWQEASLSSFDMPIFALELGGVDISEFEFPEKGLCIIGSEEVGVSKEALDIADKSLGRVSIKQYGAKGSINVACATSILLYKWMESSDIES